METRIRFGVRAWITALAVLALAVGAQAATVTNVSLVDQTAGVWGDGILPEPDCPAAGPCGGRNFEDDSAVSAPNGWNEWQTDGNESGTIAGGAQSFTSNHAYYLATQAQNAIANDLHYDGQVDYSISVSALPAETWELTIDVTNAGVVTHTDENATFAEIADSTSFGTLSQVSRTADSGSVAFAGSATYGPTATFNDNGGNWSQSGQFTVTGTGNQTFSFSLLFGIDTDMFGELSFGSGDSLCFNGGLAAQGDGPNTDCGVGGGTGLSVDGSIATLVPEPSAMLMGAFGLLSLAAMGRRTSKTL